jgi:NitT/TauT family transport system permease protein
VWPRAGPISPRTRTALRTVLAVAFWLGVWQVAAAVVDQEILLVSPAGVLARLADLVATADFWATVAHSLARIGAGFALAALAGVLGAALAARFVLAEALLTPLATVIRTMPVVSFIILVLIWADSGRLATVVSVLMVAPIMYANVLEGIRHRDPALLEVAAVFGVPLRRRLPAVDVPAVLPFFAAGCRIGMGLAWKSGIAAEVIGLPEGSIGERLYEAKVFLGTADLFAWTAVIVTLSFCLERALLALLATSPVRPLRPARGRDVTSDRGTTAPLRAPGPSRGRDPITLRGITKRFGSHTVLDNLDLDLPAGRVTAVTGANGSGKTTLTRILLGLISPEAGTIGGLDGARRAAVFQEDRLCDQLSAVGNVRLVVGRGVALAAVRAELGRVGLSADRLDRPVRELSGGQRRRVALARALAVGADVIVLDEPFTGLDAEAKNQALRYVRERCLARTTVLVTHDPVEAAALDARVVTLAAPRAPEPQAP